MNQPANGKGGLSGWDSWSSGHVSALAVQRAPTNSSSQTSECCPPDDLLTPDLFPPEEDSTRLLFADYFQRCARGEEADFHDYADRFPAHKTALLALFQEHQVQHTQRLASGSFPIQFGPPQVGGEVFGFKLWHELGAGAFAKVFLAEQVNLAGRPVVIKISERADDEPQTLAQVQHTNIVPIHSVHESADTGLQAVCMPYFGGASLGAVLQSLWLETKRPTRGEELIRALERVQAPSLQAVKAGAPAVVGPSPVGQTPKHMLCRRSYFQAVAWIMARLAEGLQHAHERGIFHRDIKPHNILLTADGQPMLLDFNLAFQVQENGLLGSLGGTIAYMAPEHLAAFKARCATLAMRVDHRSDVYSLGLVFTETLTGQKPPFAPNEVPSARTWRKDLPWSLESILRKCLALEPEDRYQQAEHLAEDLRRFLEDRPLLYAPELSWAERINKWMRRHPRMTSAASVALAAAIVLTAATTTLVGVRAHLAATQKHLEAELIQNSKRAYQEGTVQALLLLNADNELQDNLGKGLTVCKETLAEFGVCDRDDWQNHPNWQRLSPIDQQQFAEHTQELLLLMAWAQVRLAPADPAVLADALALVDKAEAIAGLPPSPALWRDRAHYRHLLGDRAGKEEAERRMHELPPATARDHYLLATSIYRTEGPAYRSHVIERLDRAIALDPRSFWSYFQRGVCRNEAGEFDLAAADFGVCVGLWQEFPWGHHNLGFAQYRGNHPKEAIRSYTLALERAPDFTQAYQNRGLAFLDLKQFDRALADYSRAVELKPDDATLHAGRAQALEGLGRTTEADDAFRLAFAHLPAAPPHLQSAICIGFGNAVYRRLPQEADAAFEAVLRRDAGNLFALYGRALVAGERGDAVSALRFLGRCIDANAFWLEPRRHRAIQLARIGRFRDAFEAIDWCLLREPPNGATHYAAACVTAQAAAKDFGDAAAATAIAHLRAAFNRDFGKDTAATDPDLAALRDLEEFQQLVAPYSPPQRP